MSHGHQAHPGPAPRSTAAVAVECPGCRAHLAAGPALAGAAAVCPACQAEFLVPRVAAATIVAAPVALTEPPLPSTRRRPDDAFVIAETDAVATGTGVGPLVFEEPVRTVTAGGAEIALRRLAPEERRRRRAWRNLVIFVIGAALLAALVVILTGGGR